MPDLEALLANIPHRAINPSDAYKKAIVIRRTKALNMARSALTQLHRSDYEDLYQQALAKVHAELGPLPD